MKTIRKETWGYSIWKNKSGKGLVQIEAAVDLKPEIYYQLTKEQQSALDKTGECTVEEEKD